LGFSKAIIRDTLIYVVKFLKDIDRNKSRLNSHRHRPCKIYVKGEVADNKYIGMIPRQREFWHMREIKCCWVAGRHSQAETANHSVRMGRNTTGLVRAR
jgi:hypothetical protein